MLQEPTLYTVKAILILDDDGKRLVAKYYDDSFPSYQSQIAFENKLFQKTKSLPNAEIILFEGQTCLYKSNVDVYFYVIGDALENELILANVLNCLFDSVNLILRRNVEKRYVLESLDLIFLAVDELCDRGIFLENDSAALVSCVGAKPEDTPLGEQTVAQVVKSATEQLKWSLLK